MFSGTVSGITKSMVRLSNVDNTADANKPISTATQNALNCKAPVASPTFTGTVSGITKSMVGLGNVDNTTDANKPISIATQTSLNSLIGGSGTATYLPRFTDARIMANSGIQENANSNIGIGGSADNFLQTAYYRGCVCR